MKMNDGQFKNLLSVLSLYCISACAMLYADSLPQAQVYTASAWYPFNCRTLDSIADYSVDPANLELSKYGGWQDSASYEDTGLSPSTQYTYTVTARDKSANQNTTAASSGALATTDAAGSPPAAPSGLSATAIAKTQIDISWTDNASDETGFKIERSTRNNGSFAVITTVGADVTFYSDTTVRKGTTYFYRVRATNSDGDSAYSNEASVTTPK